MLDRFKQLFNKWEDSVSKYWVAGRYILAILTYIWPPVLVALAIILVGLGISAVFQFLRQYYTQLIMAALGLWLFAAWRDKHRANKIELDRKEQEVRERQDYSDRLEVARTQDATYTTLAKVIFSVVRELGPLGIVPPVRLSNLYAPTRTVIVANKTISLNIYLLQKDRETVDTDLLQHTLQTKIDQRLKAGEFPEIPGKHTYQGHSYSGVMIDTVRDDIGFVNIYATLVNDAYCRYFVDREVNKDTLLPSVDRRDIDY